MRISYPLQHRWLKELSGEILGNYGTGAQKQLRSSLGKLADAHIRYTVEPLTPAHIEWFSPFYAANLADKNNAIVHDVYDTTLGKQLENTYFILTTWEYDEPRGAVILARRPDRIATVYRAFERNWQYSKLRSNPALLSEYFLDSYAHECGYSTLSHGKDRNPYGPNAAIGLATFKLAIGCRPYCYESQTEMAELDTSTVTEDTLVLEAPTEGTPITTAYLIAHRETLSKYEQVAKYPERLRVTVIERTS